MLQDIMALNMLIVIATLLTSSDKCHYHDVHKCQAQNDLSYSYTVLGPTAEYPATS